ncbi:hypothetical protein J5226_23830 [Lysobacter sp. K5869]|uniref:hypothetical protein n=1 Tax=Lysobacter sp. K5869 TaxID=2820808 RepID=UPI001C0622C9|nr:hypothetical protein [Lysobacter sp. K5869]QWP76572.1 hypothetical protein J5226_23830 [Lysobacter sp. K5869]
MRVVLAACWGCAAFAATADERPPVLVDMPACEHRKLGVVSIEAGTRVSEASLDKSPPAVHYGRAFARLADAAAAQGANAVVLRGHRATFYTPPGLEKPKVVHVRLNGAAIRIEGDPAACALVVADPLRYKRESDAPGVVQTTAAQAYSEE